MKQFLDTHGRHRRLEAMPLLFTVLTVMAILVGTVIEFLPIFLVQSNVPRIATVEPWTPLELAGRDVYIREGCNNCHSQMVRPFRQEIERYGEYGKPGETIYERPFLWGSKRTGPDLARVGGKYPHLWHVRHMEDPRSTSPRSLMPPYAWLLANEVHLDDLPAKLRTLQRLGTPYTDEEVENAVASAQAQAAAIAEEVAAQGGPEALADKEITALVAFLQRLGTDIHKDPAVTEAPPSPDEPTALNEPEAPTASEESSL